AGGPVRAAAPAAPGPGDLARLGDGELLNDAVLDWFLGRMARGRAAAGVHVFSALFFSRLSEGGHERVRTWTRRLRRETPAGLFSRDFLL
ncbi:unnamed protein product, partial [Prorocentrum cordatum]